MKYIILLLFYTFTSGSWASGGVEECFDELPGEVGIPFNTPDKVKITAITVNRKNTQAFIATEYIGANNLQALVYLKKNNKYCPAGDLGATIFFRTDARSKNEGFYPIVVESNSGSNKFYRTFRYQKGIYLLHSCRVKLENSQIRKCTDNEK